MNAIDQAIQAHDEQNALVQKIDAALFRNDLSKLSDEERVVHVHNVCRSLGLNPLTQPLQYITLSGRLTLYAKRDAADQLRKLHGINIEIAERTVHDGLLTVHVRATDKTGRTDEDFGVVPIAGLRGEAAANAFLKAVTKAKRRVTLSIAGLGFLDETEVEDIADARPHAFGHLAAPEAERVTEDGEVRTSGDDYVERWLVQLENAVSAEDLATEWNSERTVRGKITWPDDEAFARLKAAVTKRIEELKKPDLATQRLKAQDT
jgi:hypothetical protein